VGFVCVWIEHDPDEYLTTLTDYAYISDIVVLAAYRGRGLGHALLRRAEQFAARCGATTLKINVLARNPTAARVYRSVGFRDYQVTLVKDTSPPKANE